MSNAAAKILKYIFYYFFINLLVTIPVRMFRTMFSYLARMDMTLSENPLGYTVFMVIAYLAWNVIMILLVFDEAYEDFADDHKLEFAVPAGLIISTGIFIFVASTQAGLLVPNPLIFHILYPQCAVTLLVRDCFYSCIILSLASLAILLFTHAFGRIAFLNNYPYFARAYRQEKKHLQEMRKKYYSVDDE